MILSCQKTSLCAILGSLVVLLAGCGGGRDFQVATNLVPYTQEQMLAREMAKDARYELREGDVLRLAFKYESHLNQDALLVLPDGYISPMGLSRSIKAAGKNLDQLSSELTAAYGEDYRNPDLSVMILEIAQPEIYVLGMVKLPGLYKMPANGNGVIQAIASAGGFLPDASRSEVVLMRATDQGFMLRNIDLSHLEKAGLSDLLLFDVEPYDIVFVPRSGMGDFKYLVESVFGTSTNISRFFWDVYAIANIDKVQNIIR